MERQERRDSRTPIIRSITGGIIMLGSVLAGGFFAKDLVIDTIYPAVTFNVGKDLDDKEVPPPASWNEAYRWAIGQRFINGVRGAGDTVGGVASIAGLAFGYRMISVRRRRY